MIADVGGRGYGHCKLNMTVILMEAGMLMLTETFCVNCIVCDLRAVLFS